MLAHYPFDRISECKKKILVDKYMKGSTLLNDPNHDFDDIKHSLFRNMIVSCWREAGKGFGDITGTSNFKSDDSQDKGCQFIAKGADSMRTVCEYILKDLKYGKDDHILWEFSVEGLRPTSELH
jgi:hypothetical protein